jgi:hypothetical protein
MKRFISAFVFTLICSASFGQYSLKYLYADSLERYNVFWINIIETSTGRTIAEADYDVNWYKFTVDVNHGQHSGNGQIIFDRQKVYENDNKLVLTLTNYLKDTLARDTLVVPDPRVIRLNYLHEFPNVNERLKLDLGALYSNGRSAKTSTDAGLDWNLFTLTCRGDTFNPEFFFVPYFADSPNAVYVKATYNYDSTVNHGFVLNCTYSDTLEFDFSGADGERGKNGRDALRQTYSDANGGWGWNGGDGEDAPNLNMVLIPLEAGKQELLKVLLLSENYQHYFFIDPTKSKIKVDLDGGRGGLGGNGGNGADGTPNATSNRQTQGGNGGRGGSGGNGGNGGELKVITSQAGKEYAKVVLVKNDGGKGGLAGFGGKGGITYIRKNAGFFERKVYGNNGEDGAMGNLGFDGSGGPGPILWLVDDSEILNLLLESETW